jgi:uncharacterized protein (TIGR02231 family)
MTLPSPTDPTPIETTLTTVTVYTHQARIIRQGTISLTGSESALTIAPLPLTLSPDSIRVKGSGTTPVRILGVRTQHVFATAPVADRVAALSTQIDHLETQKRTHQDTLAGLQMQRQFVQGVSEKSVDRFSRSLAQQQVGLPETAALLDWLGTHHGTLSSTLAAQEQHLQQIDKQLQALQQERQQIQTPRPQESYCLIVSITPDGPGTFDLEISYLVDRASWTPLYDLRVSPQTNRLHLSYLAEVQQTTGEDWLGVALTLSTAKPGLGSLPPKLSPWYVDLPTPPPALSIRRKAAPAASRMESPDEMAFMEQEVAREIPYAALSAPAPVMYEAASTVAQVSHAGGIVTFQIDGNNNVPGDGGAHKITIFRDEYPCAIEYIAMPKLVSFAYLQAVVSNPSDGATLLPGQANIFRDDEFVGTTDLANISPGQEFKLNLGIDEGLQIQRELIEREVDKRFLGSQRRITFGYRIGITNLRDRPATLHLTEQIPVRRNEQIKVRLTRSAPPLQPGEMGALEWHLNLAPLAKQEVSYQFVVEYPQELTVIGLDL